ncbi:MAG TPA: dihydropteroate synthase [Vulgatibacter sp.]|nr:dihydropteroate synthase [Vulgatibacter sp.]
MIRARFLSVDKLPDLGLALRALGFPRGAVDFLAGSLPQGHLLVSGLEAPALELLRNLVGTVPGAPRILEGVRPGAVLLSGRLSEIKLIGTRLQDRADVPQAADAGGYVIRACFHAGRFEPVEIGPLRIGGGRALVMGILNVTPDSFSDGGRFVRPEEALARAKALVEAGADVIDVGGESTRPKGPYGEGARPVSVEEERARVEPVVALLHRELPNVPISVDTSKAEVAEAAIQAGASMVNDVRGLADDDLADVVRRHRVACCLMHMPAEPDVMAEHTSYEDVVGEVAAALCDLVDRAEARGVPPARAIVDPGLGFGKTYGQSLFLLRQLPLLVAAVGRPILVGPSRKGFLGHVTGREVGARDAATAGSVAAALVNGASMVRVHDAAACRDAVLVADAVARAEEGGAFFSDEDEG